MHNGLTGRVFTVSDYSGDGLNGGKDGGRCYCKLCDFIVTFWFGLVSHCCAVVISFVVVIWLWFCRLTSNDSWCRAISFVLCLAKKACPHYVEASGWYAAAVLRDRQICSNTLLWKTTNMSKRSVLHTGYLHLLASNLNFKLHISKLKFPAFKSKNKTGWSLFFAGL